MVHFDEYGRVAGYQRVGETAEEQPSPLVAASPTQRLITTPSGGKVLLTRKTMPPARPRAPKSTPQGSVATVAEDSVLQFLEDSEDLAKPIQKWGAIWNQDTVKVRARLN